MKRLLTALSLILIPASFALADGPGPERKMTAAEASAFNSLRAAIQNALPKVPEGYKFTFEYVSDFGDGMIPEAIKSGAMFQMSYAATYVFDSAIREGKEVSSFMDRAKGTPEQQARLAELNAKDEELGKARDQTRDRAEKDRIRAQRKAISAQQDSLLQEIITQYQAWAAAGGAQALTQSLDKSLPAKELTIRIRVNDDDVSLIDKATPYAIPGVPLAFEQSEGCADYDTYCITVFLGPFEKTRKISEYTSYQLRNAGPGIPTKARGIAVFFGGPKDRPESVRAFVQKTDLGKLKALLP